MSGIKRTIEDYIELKTRGLEYGHASRLSDYFREMIVIADSLESQHFQHWLVIRSICHRIALMRYSDSKLRRSTRIWNYIDRMPHRYGDPEICWITMGESLPDCFVDGEAANSMKFTYAR
jgi:hypothetical protein